MKTKIIATIGPATLDFEVFQEIIVQGANYIRINTAYSTPEQHATVLEDLRKMKLSEKEIKIIYDIRNKDAVPKLGVFEDFLVAVSFAESAEQLEEIKNLVPGKKIISKIESKKGVENFEEILECSWGVMIARGDLGIAVSLEKVPCVQKRLSKKILEKEKYLIIATEMLLSMTEKPKPTRAEVSDVANAVFDGAKAVMLSEETAIGKHPIEAVKYMKRIVETTEECIVNNKD